MTSYFCIQVPYDEKDIFFWLLVLEDLVKAMVFPVVMYGCESWPVKKAERRRIDAFKLWCWRRLMSLDYIGYGPVCQICVRNTLWFFLIEF